MKQERGITTTSVIIYVIVMLIVIATLSVISGYFHKVIVKNLSEDETSKRFTTFASYFVQDIQEKNNKPLVADIAVDSNGKQTYYIEFTNGNTYKYDVEGKTLYKNNIKICDNLDFCRFYLLEYEEKKYKITVDFTAGDFNKTGDNALVFYM